MYQAHNFNYPVNVRLLRKWLGTINTFFYIIKIMFRYDASTNEDPARMSIVVVSAVSQKRKVIIQSQLQPEPQKHKYCSNGQKPEPYRSEARTSQIESHLSINPSQKRWREEKKSRVFCFAFDYLNFETKNGYQFLKDQYIRVFYCFFRLPLNEPKKVFFSFLEKLPSKYYYPSFSYFVRLPSFQKSKNSNPFSRSIRKANIKAAVYFFLHKFTCDYLSKGDYGQADSRATHKMWIKWGCWILVIHISWT